MTPPFHRILATMHEIRHSAQQTADSMREEQRAQEVRREWEYIARGLDRVCLCLFVTITVLYELWLLSLTNVEPLRITEEHMNMTR